MLINGLFHLEITSFGHSLNKKIYIFYLTSLYIIIRRKKSLEKLYSSNLVVNRCKMRIIGVVLSSKGEKNTGLHIPMIYLLCCFSANWLCQKFNFWDHRVPAK